MKEKKYKNIIDQNVYKNNIQLLEWLMKKLKEKIKLIF